MPNTSTEDNSILLLGLNYPPEQQGIAPYSGSLARNLVQQGMKVRVFTTNPHYPEWKIQKGYGRWLSKEVCDGVVVRRFWHFVPRPPRGIKRLLSELTFGIRIAFARWGRTSLVVLVTPGLFSSVIAMLRAKVTHHSVPVVVWVQDLYATGLQETGQSPKIIIRLISSVESWLLRRADCVVVIHESFALQIQEHYGVENTSTTIIRNWTHLPAPSDFDRAAARKRIGWSQDEIIVLHTGNMGLKQGLSNVIDAAKLAESQRSNIKFVLVGGGSERDKLVAEGKGLSTLEFLQPVPFEEYHSLLISADCLLVNELEGVGEMAVPSKLTSYFTSGRPIIAATSLTGIVAHEISASCGGIIVPAGDPQALLDVAKRLGNDSSLATRLGNNGLKYWSNHLGESAAVTQFKDVILKLIAEKIL